MPRRREADAEDMLARCPHCRGATVIPDATRNKVPCPVCTGTGRVNQQVYLAYLGGRLDAEIARVTGTDATTEQVQSSTDAPTP